METTARTTRHATNAASAATAGGGPREHRRARLARQGWRFLSFRTPVRGYRFAGRPPGSTHPRAGKAVGLLRERDHPVDPWAVGVWVRAEDGTPWRMGYLERAVAARVAPRLDDGTRVRAHVAGWMDEPAGRWRRPVIVVEPDASRSTPPAR